MSKSAKKTARTYKSVRLDAKKGVRNAANARKHGISRPTAIKVIKNKVMRVEKTQLYKRAVDQACRKLVLKTIQRRGPRTEGRHSCRRGETVSAIEVEAYMKECPRSCGLEEAPTISIETIRRYMKEVPEKCKVRTEREALLQNEANTKDPDHRQGWRSRR